MKSFTFKAFTLAALTIAVAAANITPSFAEDLPPLTGTKVSPGDIPSAVIRVKGTPVANPGSISLFNRGTYVARYKVWYNLNGNTKTFDSEDITIGKKIVFTIPPEAVNIQVVGELYTGFLTQKKVIFNQRLDRLNLPISFTTYGNVFNPQMSRN
jgi:hypothetical protein